MKTLFIFIVLFSTAVFADIANLEKKISEGDVIFIQSQTQQAKAIAEATGSLWTHVGIIIKQAGSWQVAEAVGPLQVNSLKSFIGRSRNGSYKVMRFKPFSPRMLPQLYVNLYKYNQPYDIFFEFSNERIYCSELTYKVFKDTTGQPMGVLQRTGDLKLDGPFVKQLIEERLTSIGKELNREEPIITPVQQSRDPNLTLIAEFSL